MKKIETRMISQICNFLKGVVIKEGFTDIPLPAFDLLWHLTRNTVTKFPRCQ